jgi:hypothetical protein
LKARSTKNILYTYLCSSIQKDVDKRHFRVKGFSFYSGSDVWPFVASTKVPIIDEMLKMEGRDQFPQEWDFMCSIVLQLPTSRREYEKCIKRK